MKNNELVEILWRPESYSRLSIAQNESAKRLLKVLKISTDSVILDLGCGDGQISAKLAKIVPNGSVIGLDKSAEMIKYATSIFENTLYPNLHFFFWTRSRLILKINSI